MRRLIRRGLLGIAVPALAIGGVLVVGDARHRAADQAQVAQLVTQFGTDALFEEVMAERLLRGNTAERRAALQRARQSARNRLGRALAIDRSPALAGLAVLHDRYGLAVDAEQEQAGRDFELRSAIHDRQVVPAFTALQTSTAAAVNTLGRRARASQDRADTFSASAIALALLIVGALVAWLVRQRARLARAEQLAGYEDARRRLTEASERRVRQVVERLADALLIVDAQGQIVDANPAATTVYGRTHEELLTLSIFDLSLVTPDTLFADMRRVRERGSIRVEGTHLRRDGTRFPIEVTLSTHRLDGADLVIAAVRDITERRAVEAQARRGAAVLEQLDAAVIGADEEQRITTFNPAAEQLFGRARSEVIGHPLASFAFFDGPGTAIGASGGTRLDAVALAPDGRQTPVVVARTEIPGPEAAVAGTVIVAVDVTDERRMAAELGRRVRQQASVVQLGQLAIEGGGREQLFDSAIAALRDTLGVEHADVLQHTSDGEFHGHASADRAIPAGGLAARALAHPEGLRIDDLAAAGCANDPLVAPTARAALLAVVRGEHDDYGVLVAQSDRGAFSDEDLSYVRAVAHVLGVAIRREIALDLERRLEQSTRLESLGMLAGGVAHDFNNLLSVIMSFVQFAIDGGSDDRQRREDLGEALHAARRAAELTAQLLAFSRVGHGEPERIDVNAAVDQTRAMLRRTLGHNVQLEARLDPSVAPIELVPGQLEQVLVNLAVNARDAMPGGGLVTIRTRDGVLAGTGERAVELSVSDTGTGMPDDVLAKAFDPFFSTKQPGAGTGLGLATVYGIVSRAGGEAEIASAPNGGTTIVLRFVAAPGPAPRPDDDGRPGLPDGAGTLVLVVEDEPQVLALTTRILRMHGYRVAEAGSPSRALELQRDLRPPVVLTDVVMPGMSGAELAEQLRATDPQVQVIFMTGYAGSADLDGFGAGTRILQKPFSAAELLAALDGCAAN